MQTGRTLNDFISNIKSRSLARQNRFTLAIEGGLNSQDGNLVELFCEQAVLPGLNFASQPTRSFGEQREVIYDRNFESIQLTFLVDREMKVKQFFDKWSGSLRSYICWRNSGAAGCNYHSNFLSKSFN